MKTILKLLSAVLLNLIFITGIVANLPPLIPREVMFSNPTTLAVQISPDGQWLSYLRPSTDKVLNIWLQDVKFKQNPILISHDTHRGIHDYAWAMDSKHVLYFQDQGGNENSHLYSIDITNKSTKDLTPYPKGRAENLMLNKDYPSQVLIGLNNRDPQVFDMYRIDLNQPTLTLDTQNPGDVTDWLTDSHFQIRAAAASNNQDGSTSLRLRKDSHSPWKTLATWPFGESGDPVIFSKDGKSLVIESNLTSNTSQLQRMDSETGKIVETIASDPKSDVSGILVDPNTYKLQAVEFEYLKPSWQILDASIKNDFATLRDAQPGIFSIESRDLKDRTWIVSYYSDIQPVQYYQFDRDQQKLKLLYVARPELKNYTLSPMQPVTIQTRDGMDLVAYLTIPAGLEAKNRPMILLVHGGPWARDSWGYDSETQWLANRGYTVLQVNYRGSDGFGKKFLNAGNGQWGVGSMQHDLTDSVAWAIKQGIADPKKVCIYGGSYGGYATLAGLSFTPNLYACGVDIVGPSNLQTLVSSIPDYWKPEQEEMLLRIGDVDKDPAFNQKISPLFHAQNIHAPLLIAQGLNNPRVKIAQSDSIVKTLTNKNIPVTYIVYTDEGHGFIRPENRLDFYGRVEEFLAKVLQGRRQPWEAIPGSTAKVVSFTKENKG